MKESWEIMDGMGYKISLSMPAGRRRDENIVACGVMLCSHKGRK